jgi:hypothetical protein
MDHQEIYATGKQAEWDLLGTDCFFLVSMH